VRGQLTSNASGARVIGLASNNGMISANGNAAGWWNGTAGLDTAGAAPAFTSAFGAAAAFDVSGRSLVKQGVAVVSDGGGAGDRSNVYLGRCTLVSGGNPYGDGRYDFVGISAFRPTNARLLALAVAA
jgi:hypothetical protein